MVNERKPKKGLIIILLLIAAGGLSWTYRHEIKDWWINRAANTNVPVAVNKDDAVKEDILDTIGPTNQNNNTNTTPEPEPLPAEYNLAVPFTTQAPYSDWNLPYQEACEEASAAIVHYYWAGKTFTQAIANEEILSAVDFETTTYGDYKDTTAEQTAQFIRDFYHYDTVDVIYNPTVEHIKREVFEGNPVIVPAYGKVLENPNFRSGGPLYHMLVIKGYTADTFITNDPGTRKGADFIYSIDNLMTAMGDWNNGHPESGRKVMIVVRGNA